MKPYIKIRLNKMRHKPIEEQKRMLVDLYNELEDRGMTHKDVFMLINLVIAENINNITQEIRNENEN